MEKRYKYLVVGFWLLVPIILIAFYESYFIFILDFPKDISVMVHLHALVAIIWVAMLIVQPILINKRRVSLHKKIGQLSYLIFPLFVATSVNMIYRLLQSDYAEVAIIPIGETIIITSCYILAVYFRNHPALHMRYMIGTALVLLGPTLGRIFPLVLPSLNAMYRENLKTAVIELLILLLLLLDIRYDANYKPYLLMGIAWGIHHFCYNWLLAT